MDPDIHQTGGKLLGEGSYGCVFTPPLLSEGEKTLKPSERGLISKVMLPVHGNREVGIGDFLSKIPFAQNYFVYATSKSASKPSSEQTEKDLILCEKTLEHALESLVMYKMPYAGSSGMPDFKNIYKLDMWAFGKHLLEGLTLMITHGVLHTDLHSGNITIDQFNVPRIIDWGVSIVIQSTNDDYIKEIVDTNEKGFLNKKRNSIHTSQSPPEIPLFQGENLGFNRSEVIEAILLDSNRKVINRALNQLLGIEKEELVQQLEEFQTTSAFFANAKNDGALDWFKRQGQYTFDTWSIGVYLIKIIAQLDRYDDIFKQSKYRETKSKMFAALRGMCNFNPKKRFNAVKALSVWDSPDNRIIRGVGAGWL